MRNNKNGFTLIELSIVLVVIGLLTGGILVGRNLIESVKIKNVINQVTQYDIMFRNFKTKYETLPGDSPHFSPAGNGDGVLQSGNGTTWSPAYNGEYRAVWAHLRQAGIMNDGVNYMYEDGGAINIPTFDGATPNFPKLDWSKNSGIVVVASINGENHGIYRLANFTNAPAGNYAATGVEDIFTPEQALSIDVKMDDGLNLYSGIVYGGDGLGPRYSPTNPAQYPDTHPENDCFNTSFIVDSGYGSSPNVVDCHLLIKYLPNER